MNLFSNTSKPAVRIVATILLAIGAISLASAILVFITHLFLPVVVFGAATVASWWAIRKLLGTDPTPIGDQIKDAGRRILGEAVRLIGKTLQAGAAAVKAIREDPGSTANKQ
jgi:hypothetical protein